MIASSSQGYSSHVIITLDVDGARLRVARVGPGSMILRESRVVKPASNAVLSISVDGQLEEHAIVLPHGIDGTSMEVAYF